MEKTEQQKITEKFFSLTFSKKAKMLLETEQTEDKDLAKRLWGYLVNLLEDVPFTNRVSKMCLIDQVSSELAERLIDELNARRVYTNILKSFKPEEALNAIIYMPRKQAVRVMEMLQKGTIQS